MTCQFEGKKFIIFFYLKFGLSRLPDSVHFGEVIISSTNPEQ